MVDSEVRKLFYEGVALFNDSEFFEAHEVWEELWNDSIGQEHLNYQGLIQFAACLLQVQRGFFDGSRKLYAKAMEKLKKSEPVFHDIELHTLASEIYEIVAKLPSDRQGDALSCLCEFPKILVSK